jgi:hypothetical protein
VCGDEVSGDSDSEGHFAPEVSALQDGENISPVYFSWLSEDV